MKKLFILISTVLLFTSCNRHEIRETKLPNGQLIEQYQVKEIKDGSFAKDGFYKKWHNNGQIVELGEYSINKKTKAKKNWYANGQIKLEGTYKEDSLDGDFKQWYENGKGTLTTGKFDIGKSIGKWQTWYENDQLWVDVVPV
jgi:antitoxin component YwqK of YwqJK toxin-antitoxin module